MYVYARVSVCGCGVRKRDGEVSERDVHTWGKNPALMRAGGAPVCSTRIGRGRERCYTCIHEWPRGERLCVHSVDVVGGELRLVGSLPKLRDSL